ncbi:phosphonate ABC transporter substrate-binding protein [Aphanothece hegewaldii CCALA 016]|uniref:Phosphonate ABC transporter substrate-binding protein n=1 Tax=Aphanothece hegewaldii CCALA 016 TaxID=2107694 RepID=A0A2T1LZA4_9CHRO|nr:PhnD/SsuA/transferrin family substrate-binding protein [Aphanothece hegewaldii]PSF37745.1 phosphonate ABC transporter substrate-binding protein [Aphanothece hegewaldii CCALA 016]
MRFSRRLFIVFLFFSACQASSLKGDPLVIGSVSYGQGEQAINQYEAFKQYLEQQTRSLIELEPAFNENKALERIRSQAWSLVFAPPGLAAIAMSQYQYKPLLPLDGISTLRSVIVVRQDSPFQDLKSLTGKAIALGQIGSATGYYFPIFNLYGLTIAELHFLPTPKSILEAVADGRVAAGSLSMEQFKTYKTQFKLNTFRILFTDSHSVPSGVVLIAPNLSPSRQEEIFKILNDTPSMIALEAGFVPNAPVPNYDYMISVVERVRGIFPEANHLETQNVRLFPSR